MENLELSKEQLELLNSKDGLHALLKGKKVNVWGALRELNYVSALREKQEELIKLQNWVIDNDKKVVVLTHRIELCKQTSKMLTGFGVTNKIINSKVKELPDQNDFSCFVAMVETLKNRINDEKLHLDVKTGWRRYENLNLRLVGSQFSQWQAKISGTIQQDDQEIVLLNEYGLLEQHYAKW